MMKQKNTIDQPTHIMEKKDKFCIILKMVDARTSTKITMNLYYSVK